MFIDCQGQGGTSRRERYIYIYREINREGDIDRDMGGEKKKREINRERGGHGETERKSKVLLLRD